MHLSPIYRCTSQRRGFTLVELLVVVAIVLILMSLSFTATSIVREQARRVSCLRNLQQWGAAVFVAAQDNNNTLLPSPWDPTFPRAVPCYMPIDPPAAYLGSYGGDVANQFTLNRMVDYMDGGERVRDAFNAAKATATAGMVDLPIGAFSGWRCPSQRGGIYFQVGTSNGPQWSDFLIGMGYSYFARIDLWDKNLVNMFPNPAWKSHMPGQTAKANQVLMNDTIWAWERPNWMGPNHVKSFSSTENRGDLRRMAGNNTLYGDGRVVWKVASEFAVDELMDGSSTLTAVPHLHPMSGGFHAESWDIW